MQVVPKAANDMMNVGRLSGFDVCTLLVAFDYRLQHFYLGKGGYVFIGVCLLAGLCRNYSTDFHTVQWKGGTWVTEGNHTHTVRFNGHFPGEPGLAGCPLNSPSPFIPGLRILLGQT